MRVDAASQLRGSYSHPENNPCRPAFAGQRKYLRLFLSRDRQGIHIERRRTYAAIRGAHPLALTAYSPDIPQHFKEIARNGDLADRLLAYAIPDPAAPGNE